MVKMRNNVYGLIGIGVRHANWNAGWDNLPKRNADDIVTGSPYALQFCIKNQWDNEEGRVLGVKTIQSSGICNTISQRYKDLFKKEDKGIDYKKDSKEEQKLKYMLVRNNLLSCKDVLNFGVAYTGATTINIKGVVQFTDGENKYEDTIIIEEKGLSPYGNSKKKDVTMSTNWTKYITDEAHYVYDFSIFPKEYDKYINDGFKGYTEADYEEFKKAVLIGVSNYNSKTKAGCKNEFGMFIKVKENNNYLLDLNCLQDYIRVYKNDEDKIVYDLITINDLLNKVLDKIEDVEIYYNPRTVDIKGIEKSKTIKIFDLITKKKIPEEGDNN